MESYDDFDSMKLSKWKAVNIKIPYIHKKNTYELSVYS